MPHRTVAHPRGGGETSFHQPFPGCPGVSQSRSQWIISGRCASTKSESGLEATHAPAARLPTLSRSLGSQRHVSLAKSVRRKRRSDRLEL